MSMSIVAICSRCGQAAEYATEHAANADGWRDLSIDAVIGPANRSEWTGVCPDCSETGS